MREVEAEQIEDVRHQEGGIKLGHRRSSHVECLFQNTAGLQDPTYDEVDHQWCHQELAEHGILECSHSLLPRAKLMGLSVHLIMLKPSLVLNERVETIEGHIGSGEC